MVVGVKRESVYNQLDVSGSGEVPVRVYVADTDGVRLNDGELLRHPDLALPWNGAWPLRHRAAECGQSGEIRRSSRSNVYCHPDGSGIAYCGAVGICNLEITLREVAVEALDPCYERVRLSHLGEPGHLQGYSA